MLCGMLEEQDLRKDSRPMPRRCLSALIALCATFVAAGSGKESTFPSTTRFKAIVSGAPVIDQYSEYGTESESWYDRWYYGKPWERPGDAWRQSPLAYVGSARTPMLLLQGQADTSDLLGQAREMYRALRQNGVPVSLVVYPRDDHDPLARALDGAPVTESWHGFDARRRIESFLQKAFDSVHYSPK
jgi:dipeptidyl aminopeptidase/acylaminoacyl peptidase